MGRKIARREEVTGADEETKWNGAEAANGDATLRHVVVHASAIARRSTGCTLDLRGVAPQTMLDGHLLAIAHIQATVSFAKDNVTGPYLSTPCIPGSHTLILTYQGFSSKMS